MKTDLILHSAGAACQQQACSAGDERSILVTVYIYKHDSDAVNVDLGHVMRDMNCSIFATCELVQRFFTISTDAYATNAECVERFISALKASGVNVGKHDWSTLPNKGEAEAHLERRAA